MDPVYSSGGYQASAQQHGYHATAPASVPVAPVIGQGDKVKVFEIDHRGSAKTAKSPALITESVYTHSGGGPSKKYAQDQAAIEFLQSVQTLLRNKYSHLPQSREIATEARSNQATRVKGHVALAKEIRKKLNRSGLATVNTEIDQHFPIRIQVVKKPKASTPSSSAFTGAGGGCDHTNTLFCCLGLDLGNADLSGMDCGAVDCAC